MKYGLNIYGTKPSLLTYVQYNRTNIYIFKTINNQHPIATRFVTDQTLYKDQRDKKPRNYYLL
jgi:hypothetical protein